MNIKDYIEDKPVVHPLEDVLNIEPQSTILPIPHRETTLTPHTSYDEKDVEIEEQLEELYSAAIISYETQQQNVEITDPKYAARGGEVANQFLSTALNALHEKVLLKKHKDDHTLKAKGAGTPKNVKNTMIIADRNDVLRAMMEGKAKAQ